MRNLFIVDIEPLDSRYTKQWFEWIPELAKTHFGETHRVIRISGTPYPAPQKGAFFNFASTCGYKAEQAKSIAEYFEGNHIQENDIFFFTDAWNQTIHTVRYISELNGIPVKCAGIWHAGWYDPTDILGMKIKNTQWVEHLEMSMASAYDMNFFGTKQHLDKFIAKHTSANRETMHVCGYPLEYIRDLRNNVEKQNIVVFPHRLNEDKAPWLFDLLETYVCKTFNRTDISFVKTQELNLSKQQYYDFLKQCKVVFSANKHENLGIGTFEAMTAGCIPLVPNKLSYAEMYNTVFKYDIDSNADIYTYPGLYMESLAKLVINFIDGYYEYNDLREMNADRIQQQFFDGTEMMNLIKRL